jgi:nitrite reductase/ring-hydroxylating ferredoxin subunit
VWLNPLPLGGSAGRPGAAAGRACPHACPAWLPGPAAARLLLRPCVAGACASHNSRFDLTTGESVGIPVVPTLPVYACKIEGDAILVDIDQQLNDAPIPHRPCY